MKYTPALSLPLMAALLALPAYAGCRDGERCDTGPGPAFTPATGYIDSDVDDGREPVDTSEPTPSPLNNGRDPIPDQDNGRG